MTQQTSVFGGFGIYQGSITPGNPSYTTTPLVNNADRLGSPGFGFGARTMDYAQAAAPGNVTINKPVGQVQIAAGAKTITITNNLVSAASHINVTLCTVDATLTKILNVVRSAGSFVINCDFNATASVTITFEVVGTDT